jgi:hypothetical protein
MQKVDNATVLTENLQRLNQIVDEIECNPNLTQL